VKCVLAVFSLLAVFGLQPPSVLAESGENNVARLTFVNSPRACPGSFEDTVVFGASTAEVYVVLSIPYTDKANVSFKWTDPSGEVVATHRKTGFRVSGEDELYVWDYVNPSSVPGWWIVEAHTDDGYLSKSVLLTDNRQVWTLITGDRDSRLGTVKGADTSTPVGEDVIRVALRDRLPEVRAAAAVKLKDVEAEWAAALSHGLLSDSNPEVRLAAVEVPSGLSDAERLTVYLDALNLPGLDVRLEAVAGLASLSGPGAEKGLVRALNDPDARIRYEALSELVSRGSDAHLERLPILVRDPDRDVAGLALKETLRQEDGDLKVRSLIEVESGAYEDYSLKALEALKGLSDSRAHDVFMRYFRAGHDRRGMLSAVAAVEGPQAVAPLHEIYRLSERDDQLRLGAVKALAGRGTSAETALMDALDDSLMVVRLAAVDAAATIEDPSVKGRLLSSTFGDMQLEVKQRALSYLTERVDPLLTPYVIKALDDADLRVVALEHVSRDTRTDSLKMLANTVNGMQDKIFLKRAVAALVDAGANSDILLPFVTDGSDDVVLEAAKGLSGIEGAEACYGLMLAGGSSQDATVRAAAAEGLSGRSDDVLIEAADKLFSGVVPEGRVLRFLTGSLRSAPAIEHIVGRIPVSDCMRIRAALGPLVGRAKPYDAPGLLEGFRLCGRPLDMDILSALSRIEDDDDGALLLEAYYRAPMYAGEILTLAGACGRTKLVVPEAAASNDPEIRLKAVKMAPGLPPEDSLRLVESGIRDPEQRVRETAALTAAGAGLEDVLVRASDDPSPETRLAAATGLSKMDTGTAYETLAVLVEDADEDVSRGALAALDSEAGSVPPGVWLSFARGRNVPEDARVSAIEALSGKPAPEYAAIFSEVLKDGNEYAADEAAEGLAAIGSPSLIYVYPLLDDSKTFSAALDVVVRISDPSSVKPLAGHLSGKTGEDKTALISALGVLGTEEAVGVLLDEFGRDDDVTDLAVLKALVAAGADPDDRRVAGVVGTALSSGNETLRFYGAFAAGELGVKAMEGKLMEISTGDPSGLVRKQAGIALRGLSQRSVP